MWCIMTTQIVHSNLHLSFDFTVSVNYVEHHNISQYASYRNSWPMYCDVYRIIKSLPIPSATRHWYRLHHHLSDRRFLSRQTWIPAETEPYPERGRLCSVLHERQPPDWCRGTVIQLKWWALLFPFWPTSSSSPPSHCNKLTMRQSTRSDPSSATAKSCGRRNVSVMMIINYGKIDPSESWPP